MKQVLFVIIFISLLIQPSFAQFFDTPGFVNRFPIKTGDEVFEVKIVSNFDIPDYQFNKDEKRLSFIISSSVTNNLAEFEIPKNLINGNFTFYLNSEEISPVVKTNNLISFITVEFPGKGLHKLDIIGTTYLSEANNIGNTIISTKTGTDFTLLILIIGIIVATGVGVAIFLKKRQSHSLTKD